MITRQIRTRRAAQIAIGTLAVFAAAGATLGVAGIASAGTLPTDGPTIAMTITNNTDQAIVLQDSSNPYGRWIAAPRSVLGPHSTEIVTAYTSDQSGLGIDATYLIQGDTQALFSASDYNGGSTTEGTRVTGNDSYLFGIDRNVDSSFPAMNAAYWLR